MAPLLRAIGTGLLLKLAPKPQKTPICFIQNKAGLWILEDICRKEGHFGKVKEKITRGWEKVEERVKDIILESIVGCVVLTVWGACVLSMTKPVERLTALLDKKRKEKFASVVKAETEKNFELLKNQFDENRAQLKNQFDENRAQLKKLSEEFDAHRALTKLWVSHLIEIEKTVDPLSSQDIYNIQEAFAIFDKGNGMITLDEARSVMERLGENISESQLHKLVAESGKISLLELVRFMQKHSEASKPKEVTPKASPSSP